MGMTAKHKKSGGISYQYTGDLEEVVKATRKELEKKRESQERVFLNWQFEKAKKSRETYEKRIRDLEGFLILAEKELEKRGSEEAAP